MTIMMGIMRSTSGKIPHWHPTLGEKYFGATGPCSRIAVLFYFSYEMQSKCRQRKTLPARLWSVRWGGGGSVIDRSAGTRQRGLKVPHFTVQP